MKRLFFATLWFGGRRCAALNLFVCCVSADSDTRRWVAVLGLHQNGRSRGSARRHEELRWRKEGLWRFRQP
ncbi:hypothetical protein KCP77_17285 [Salmonella enterica subsp. enterica]|nr:hypothetical protein KCP77_17285 [Salmonella enterica subsp. enterica]